MQGASPHHPQPTPHHNDSRPALENHQLLGPADDALPVRPQNWITGRALKSGGRQAIPEIPIPHATDVPSLRSALSVPRRSWVGDHDKALQCVVDQDNFNVDQVWIITSKLTRLPYPQRNGFGWVVG